MTNTIEIITPSVAETPLDDMLVELTRLISEKTPDAVAHGCLGGEFGYGANYENEAFSMRPDYQDVECDCGSNERADAWHKANPHSETCFREVLHRRFGEYDETSGYNMIDAATRAPGTMTETIEDITDEVPEARLLGLRGRRIRRERTAEGEAAHQRWCEAYDVRNREREKIKAVLYDEYSLPRASYEWHCTCGIDERARVYFESDGKHTPTCVLELPNFLHKQTGLEVRWYKWIGRDMEVKNQPVNLTAIFEDCGASIKRSRT